MAKSILIMGFLVAFGVCVCYCQLPTNESGRSDPSVRSFNECVARGDLNQVKRLLKEKPTFINAIQREFDGVTPLHLAVRYGQIPVVQYLLEKGADVEAREKLAACYQPIHYAAKQGQERIVSILLDHKAEIHAKDVNGLTPLHCFGRGTKRSGGIAASSRRKG